MPSIDTLIRNASIIDGSGAEPYFADVAVVAERIHAIGHFDSRGAANVVDGSGHVLAPGFIDSHTHDDTSVIRTPEMLPKLSQGVTTVVTGNCGISAAPVRLRGHAPDPMNLLGPDHTFRYPTFASYVKSIEAAQPAVNVAAFVGHTAIRNNHMDSLDRTASPREIEAMRSDLRESLDHGALGLSTGLAYLSAASASTDEVLSLAALLPEAGGIYATHMRTEAAAILDAMNEAFAIGSNSGVPIVISHLKCAGIDNWGRTNEILSALDAARSRQEVACDCYPYSASSSTLDFRQVDDRVRITITWSEPYPEMAGLDLSQIADRWRTTQSESARRLLPAGAIYHCMSDDDVRAILCHRASMIGSDGLPNDPRPHPRLWGTFPRVLGYYARDLKLFSLPQAIHKMTGLPAQRFRLADRGLLRVGNFADLVMFEPKEVRDCATFEDPTRAADGIAAVWVNGVLSYADKKPLGSRVGRFLPRSSKQV